jgi:sugar phosphate isomerase/epimerase
MTWPIGLATGCCAQRPILEVLDAVDTSGVAGVEFGTPPGHFTPWEPDQFAAVSARRARAAWLPVSMHAPFGDGFDLSDPDPHRRSGAIGVLLTVAGALKGLGGRVLVVHPTDIVRAHADVQQRLEHAASSLRVLIPSAQALGLTVAVESPLPHLIGGHPDEFAWLLREAGPDVRVCLDTGHTSLGGHWRRFVDLTHDRLVHVHASDNHGRFDDHLPPGDGNINWLDVQDTLAQARYAGWIILELTCPDAPLATYFARARAQAEQLFNGR